MAHCCARAARLSRSVKPKTLCGTDGSKRTREPLSRLTAVPKLFCRGLLTRILILRLFRLGWWILKRELLGQVMSRLQKRVEEFARAWKACGGQGRPCWSRKFFRRWTKCCPKAQRPSKRNQAMACHFSQN